MSIETLETAARRVLRFHQIDEQKGGIITEETMKAFSTLEKMLDRRFKEIDNGSITVVDRRGNEVLIGTREGD